MKWVQANDIDCFSATNERDMQGLLPEILRRLIWSSVPHVEISSIDFPAGDQIRRRGWDGMCDLKSVVSPWLRAGKTGWELGAGKSPWTKATTDLRNRTKAVTPEVRSKLRFIFVTSRNWGKEGKTKSDKDAWIQKNANRGWRELLAYDANDLEQWLESQSSVAIWLAERIGKKPSDCMSFFEHWKRVTEVCRPKLNEDVFTASREESVSAVLALLDSNPSSICFSGITQNEGIDFLSALLSQLPQFQARAILVQSNSAWESLSLRPEKLILVPDITVRLNPEQIVAAVRNRKHVILPGMPWTKAQKVIMVKRPFWPRIAVALAGSQQYTKREERLAKNCCGNTSTLKRLCQAFGREEIPQWAHAEHAPFLAPYALIGGWRLEAPVKDLSARRFIGQPFQDLSFIQELSGKSEEQIGQDVATWSSGESPLFIQFGEKVFTSSREDAWFLLGKYITRSLLGKFEKLAIDVLSLTDPALELNVEQRWAATVYGKKSKYSPEQRTAIAETLALIATRPITGNATISDEMLSLPERVLQNLLPTGCNWQRWASLRAELPLLAEAAPDAFLNCIEADLQSVEPQLGFLFQDRQGLGGLSSPHIMVLRAVESLLWNASYFGRVVKFLARWAELDPGGRIMNRPANTLVRAFSAHCPQPNHSTPVRLRALKQAFTVAPDVAWNVWLTIIDLQGRGIALPVNRPSWRNWHECDEQESNLEERKAYYQSVITLATAFSAGIPSRIEKLLRGTVVANNARHSLLIELLQTISFETIDNGCRASLFTSLDHYLRRHASGEKSNMSAKHRRSFEKMLKQLKPDDVVIRHAWLFAYHSWHRNVSKSEPLEVHHAKYLADQLAALREILGTGNPKSVIGLAEICQNRILVGNLAAQLMVKPASLDMEKLLLSQDVCHQEFLRGYVNSFDEAELKQYVEQRSESVRVRFAVLRPFKLETWEWIERFGKNAKEAYWRQCLPYGGMKSLSLNRAVKSLQKAGRSIAALALLAPTDSSQPKPNSKKIIQAFEAVMLGTEERGCVLSTFDYSIRELIKILQSDKTVDILKLAQIEWNFFNTLDYGDGATLVGLRKAIEASPERLVTLIECLVIPDSAGQDSEKCNDNSDQFQRAYNVLESLVCTPGLAVDHSLDSAVLTTWILRVLKAAVERNLKPLTEIQLGRILARFPHDEHQRWPHRTLSSVLEEEASENLLRGFGNELVKRPPTFRGMIDGGDIERGEEAKLRTLAGEIQREFPRVSQAILSAAAFFANEAERHDEEASQITVGRDR